MEAVVLLTEHNFDINAVEGDEAEGATGGSRTTRRAPLSDKETVRRKKPFHRSYVPATATHRQEPSASFIGVGSREQQDVRAPTALPNSATHRWVTHTGFDPFAHFSIRVLLPSLIALYFSLFV